MFRVSGVGLRFRVQGSGFRVQGSVSRAQGVFRLQGTRSRVEGDPCILSSWYIPSYRDPFANVVIPRPVHFPSNLVQDLRVELLALCMLGFEGLVFSFQFLVFRVEVEGPGFRF